MAANREVREALLRKTGWNRQTLSYHVKQLQSRLPMSTEDAQYVLAHQNRVPLRKLDSTILTRVSDYVARLNGAGTAGAPRARAKATAPKSVLVQIAGINVEAVPGMTAAHAQEAKTMSTKAYPVLYVFENSARDVITRVLKAGVGNDWWTKVVDPKIQQRATDRMKDEGQEAWHGKRGTDPIQYVDLYHLARIVRDPKCWPYFKAIFPRETWFDGVIDDLNVSRRVVAHMNPLSPDDIKQVENGFRRWVKQLQAAKDQLPRV